MSKLTENFSVSEITQWPKWQTRMSKADRAKAIAEAEKALALKPNLLEEARRIAKHLQKLRNEVNEAFPEYEGKIGIRPLSWLRSKAWELYRKRSGLSQHVNAHAVDWIFVGVPAKDVPKLMDWAWEKLKDWDGGLARLYRNKRWSFIHQDLGRRRRWEY